VDKNAYHAPKEGSQATQEFPQSISELFLRNSCSSFEFFQLEILSNLYDQ
jgi:hypothetical protein